MWFVNRKRSNLSFFCALCGTRWFRQAPLPRACGRTKPVLGDTSTKSGEPNGSARRGTGAEWPRGPLPRRARPEAHGPTAAPGARMPTPPLDPCFCARLLPERTVADRSTSYPCVCSQHSHKLTYSILSEEEGASSPIYQTEGRVPNPGTNTDVLRSKKSGLNVRQAYAANRDRQRPEQRLSFGPRAPTGAGPPAAVDCSE